ncbi:MAG: sugar phosphate isomerase/epimerase family protein [Thermomicrobiales bacterium]
MQPAIFDMVFPRPTFAERMQAVAGAGFSAFQFDFAAVGLDSMPTAIPDATLSEIRDGAAAAGLTIAGIGGTWNMIHPDPTLRAEGMASLRAIAGACAPLGTRIVTLSTGTRDAANMWRRHPDNDTPEAWADLLTAMREALAIADEHDILLAFEPEPANVAKNAQAARELLDTLAHPRLKICFDAANIAASDLSRDPLVVIREALELLGSEVVIAHGKDIDAEGRFCPAGTGVVPWPETVAALDAAGFDGAMVLHSLSEADVPLAKAVMGFA